MNDRAEPRLRPRLVPEEAFPPYAYVPGRRPHPTRHPRGHSFGARPRRPEPPDADRWRACRAYLYGVDLFNHGYYWEAHEAWEALWNACARSRPAGSFFKALVHLAAAGVKVREGKPRGVKRHARRAAELFEETALGLGSGEARHMGLCLDDLGGWARSVAAQSLAAAEWRGRDAAVVFDFILRPE